MIEFYKEKKNLLRRWQLVLERLTCLLLGIRLFVTWRSNVLCEIQLCKWPPYTEKIIVDFKINCLEIEDIGTQWMNKCVTLEKQTSCKVRRWFNLSQLTDFTSLSIEADAKLSIVRKYDVVNMEVYDMMELSNVLNLTINN